MRHLSFFPVFVKSLVVHTQCSMMLCTVSAIIETRLPPPGTVRVGSSTVINTGTAVFTYFVCSITDKMYLGTPRYLLRTSEAGISEKALVPRCHADLLLRLPGVCETKSLPTGRVRRATCKWTYSWPQRCDHLTATCDHNTYLAADHHAETTQLQDKLRSNMCCTQRGQKSNNRQLKNSCHTVRLLSAVSPGRQRGIRLAELQLVRPCQPQRLYAP
jgi:hypothetical protein